MKKQLLFFIAFLLSLSTISCKKAIEDKKQDLVMKAITDGIWTVEKYLEGSNNITADFTDYDFKFNSDGSVTGTRAGSTSTGTWAGNISNYSITSNFPTAPDPVIKLNGVWKLTDSYWDYVEAEMTTGAGTNILHLRKKP